MKDQRKFFAIAMGSLRECQGVRVIAALTEHQVWRKLDVPGAHLYRLIEAAR